MTGLQDASALPIAEAQLEAKSCPLPVTIAVAFWSRAATATWPLPDAIEVFWYEFEIAAVLFQSWLLAEGKSIGFLDDLTTCNSPTDTCRVSKETTQFKACMPG